MLVLNLLLTQKQKLRTSTKDKKKKKKKLGDIYKEMHVIIVSHNK